MGAAGGARVPALPERCAVDPRLQVPYMTYLNFSKSDLHRSAPSTLVSRWFATWTMWKSSTYANFSKSEPHRSPQVLCHVDDVEVRRERAAGAAHAGAKLLEATISNPLEVAVSYTSA